MALGNRIPAETAAGVKLIQARVAEAKAQLPRVDEDPIQGTLDEYNRASGFVDGLTAALALILEGVLASE